MKRKIELIRSFRNGINYFFSFPGSNTRLAPFFLSNSSSPVWARKGEDALISCFAAGNPPPITR